ncbi:hypothetical protein NKG05_17995 [Oerskovia sp. M15]
MVHLAWAVDPAHDRDELARVNVEGTRRVAVAAARGRQAPGRRHVRERVLARLRRLPARRAVAHRGHRGFGEQRPEGRGRGVPGPFLGRAPGRRGDPRAGAVHVPARRGERGVAVVLRSSPACAAAPQGHLPTLVWPRGMRLQVVHADDLASAYREILVGRHPGTFNVAAEGSLRARRRRDRLAGTAPRGVARLVAPCGRPGLGGPAGPAGPGLVRRRARGARPRRVAGPQPAALGTGARREVHGRRGGRRARGGAGTQSPPLLPR